jgi:predicted transcriptional regulator
MSQADEKLAAISAQLKKGVAPQRESVRSFLLWFNAERRGYRVVRTIRNTLRRHGLATSPDFEWGYIDGMISFRNAPPDDATLLAASQHSNNDPAYRIGRLASANTIPISVPPDAPLRQIVTLMMSNDFSQLPVMTGPRDLKGAVSWKTIGTRLALKRPCLHARDCMEDAKVLTLEESLFAAISTIARHDYVLIQANDKTICGIVTATDLTDQFRLLAEPFLLVGEIENGIRLLLHGNFTIKELESAMVPGDDGRTIEAPADLTFGEYIRLIEQEAKWKKLRLEIDRAAFVAQLNRIRDIRNDVMHFDPDGLDEDDLQFLREFAQFLKRLRDVGAG